MPAMQKTKIRVRTTRRAEMETGHESPGQRFWPGRVLGLGFLRLDPVYWPAYRKISSLAYCKAVSSLRGTRDSLLLKDFVAEHNRGIVKSDRKAISKCPLTSRGYVCVNYIRAIGPASLSVLLRCRLPYSNDPPAVQWDTDASNLQTGVV